MQIRLCFRANKLTIPVNYQYILQSVIYNHLRQDKLQKEFVHNNGWKYDERSYRFFQFGGLKGKYTIDKGMITFDGEVYWEIRGIDSRMMHVLHNSITASGLRFIDQEVELISNDIYDEEIESDEILIDMISPICVYSTDVHTKHTHFYSPDEEKFAGQIADNFIRKYYAYTGIMVDDGIEVEVVDYSPKDKVITKYKGFYLDGWKGRYKLKGKRKYLNFLYQVGLGAKNAQGFGMFKVIQ